MLEEGYAAVSSRRVAAKAGVNNGLVYYYFGGMDDLFVALARRIAERSIERQQQAMSSPQPLWGLWDSIYNHDDTALLTEFVALGNHRKAIQAELAVHSRHVRRIQAQAVASALRHRGFDPQAWPPSAIVLIMAAISRFLIAEDAFGVEDGHRETVALVEELIRKLEGDRA